METLIPLLEMLIPLFAIFSLFFIPITGVMLILVSKFAFRPLAETIARALRESGQGGQSGGRRKSRELHEQVHLLAGEVLQLKEAHEFERKLMDPATFSGRPQS